MDDHDEKIIADTLSVYARKSVGTISVMLDLEKQVTARTVWTLSKKMLGSIQEFKDYDKRNSPQVRSVILSSALRPRQSMSFASFDYVTILTEEWEDTTFYKQLNCRFVFMRYLTMSDGTIVFDGVRFWSMPHQDIEAARSVWQKTVDQIRNGQPHALPTIRDSPVAHVRPRATNADDRIMTSDGAYLTKKCFWLNASYIANQVL